MNPGVVLEEFKRYLKVERGLAETTVGTYTHHVHAYLGFATSNPITLTTVTSYFERMRDRGIRSCTLFCATIATKTFHRFLCEKGYANSDPTERLTLPKLSSRLPEPLSAKEVDALMLAPAVYRFPGIRDRAILEVLFLGLRISEALSLEESQIQIGDGYMKIRGKRNRERLVPLGRMAIDALKKYLAVRSEHFGDEPGPIFLSRLGRPLSKSAFWRQLKDYARRVGIKRRVYPHLLRHSAATLILKGGGDLRSIQNILGHQSLAVTQKYLNFDHNFLRETCIKAHPRF